jgi:hypothetical protein
MAQGVFSPSVPTADDIMLGEGVVYYNYGAGGGVIGATRGGSKLEIEKTIKEIKFDGAYGAVRGLRRYEKYIPKLVINFLKLTYGNFVHGLPVTVTDGTDKDGTYKKISFDLEITASDVLTNVTFVGQKQNGKEISIYLKNALNIDNITLDFKEKDEVTSEMTYTGFYSASTPTVPPIEIRDYI